MRATSAAPLAVRLTVAAAENACQLRNSPGVPELAGSSQWRHWMRRMFCEEAPWVTQWLVPWWPLFTPCMDSGPTALLLSLDVEPKCFGQL